jgi:endonuclease YncB( thermonuclease family)
MHHAMAVLTLFSLGSMPPAAASEAECRGQDGGASAVTSISDGETLILEDGRAVRLAGVIGPKRARAGPVSEVRAEMEAAIARLTLGKKVSLSFDGRERDRYGRVLAHVYIVEEGVGVWLQGRLVEEGLARVISFPDSRLCIAELLAKEGKARAGQIGLWKTGFFAVRPADAEDLLFRLAQSYEIVEGTVRNVTEIKGRYYLNFGENWRRDFTIFVPAANARLFAGKGGSGEIGAAAPDLSRLDGRRVRVRGWLKNFNGPSITVTHPEQIEILDMAASETR